MFFPVKSTALTGALFVTLCGAALAHDGTHETAQTDPILAEIAHFFATADVFSGPEYTDCTLSGGTETTCFQITVKPEPTTYTPGPWCPTSVTDGPDQAGIWLEGGTVYNADGAFMQNLALLYDDDKWQMVDPETGEIKVTDTRAQCAAAARPDVGPEYENYCVQCELEYMDEGHVLTYVIPLEQFDTWRASETNLAGSGIAANGIRLDGSAPVDAILGAYTVAPFDDCGGHVNLHVGYHYHAVTDCLETSAISADESGAHADQIGIAMDGYKILSTLNSDGTAPDDLDRCNGHETGTLGYHYHAGASGSNAILGCLAAEYGCVLEGEGGTCDASARPPRP